MLTKNEVHCFIKYNINEPTYYWLDENFRVVFVYKGYYYAKEELEIIKNREEILNEI